MADPEGEADGECLMANKRNWSYRTYGKNALGHGASLQVGGLENYLQRIQAAGNNVDEAVEKAVQESALIVLADMKAGAERHRRTGAVADAVEASPVQREGGHIFVKVGIDLNEHPEAIHAVFQEYGDSHSPQFPAPFIRPAYDNNESAVKKKQREVLKREGMPVD